MVNQIINVIVNSKGAVTVKKQLDSIGDSAKTTTTYLNSMRAILAAALTFSGASRITETIDNFTQLQNRLKIVSSGMEEVSASWTKLMNIANMSYTSIDNTVNLYYRVAYAFKSWGESAEEAMKFTESFNKAAILSGSTMQTTSQAIYQFSQALNKGKLDGDEFRSVMEGLPYVSNLLQKSLGISRKELYAWAEDGKISVDKIKRAFDEAAKTIDADFSKITPTIAMATMVLKNNWTDFLGAIQNSTGVFSGIAYIILAVANNFKLLAAAMVPVAATMAFMAGKLVIGLLVTGFKDMVLTLGPLIARIWALNAALLANPFGLAAVAIAALVAGVVYFRNELGLTNEVLSRLWSSATKVFSYMLGALSPITAAVTAVGNQLGGWSNILNSVKAVAVSTFEIIQEVFTSIATAAQSAGRYIWSSLGPVFTDLISLAQSFYDLAMEIKNLYVKSLTPAVEALLPAFKVVWSYIEPALRKFVSFTAEIFEGWKIIGSWLQSNFLPIVKDVFDGWIAIIRGVISVIQTLIDALKYALSLMTKVGGSGGGSAASPGMNYGGQFYAGEFASGGQFKVGGTNAGRDTTPVMFRANRGERVTVETKKQQRSSDSGQAEAANVNVPVSIVNVFDPSMVPTANESSAGRRSIVNAIKADRDEIAYILGVG